VKEIALIAVRRAIKDCQEAKLLTNFWESLTMEDIIMLSTEWDWNLALQVCGEEEFEEDEHKETDGDIGVYKPRIYPGSTERKTRFYPRKPSDHTILTHTGS
jgi:hypothetical protein